MIGRGTTNTGKENLFLLGISRLTDWKEPFAP